MATAPTSSAAPLIAGTASGLESSSRGRSSGVDRSRAMTWNTTPETTVTVGSHRAIPGAVRVGCTAAPARGRRTTRRSSCHPGSRRASTPVRRVRRRGRAPSSRRRTRSRPPRSRAPGTPIRPAGRARDRSPPRRPASRRPWRRSPVASASPADDPVPSVRATSEANVATISAGISGQVTTLARTRLGGCMWPSWQQKASPHSGSALIPGPVTARSRRTCSGSDAGDPASATDQGADHVSHPSPRGHRTRRAQRDGHEGGRHRGGSSRRLALHDRRGHQRPARPVRPGAAHLVAGLRQPLGGRDVGGVGPRRRGHDPGGHEPPPASRRGHPVTAVAVVRSVDGRCRHRGLAGHRCRPSHPRAPRRHDERAAARESTCCASRPG